MLYKNSESVNFDIDPCHDNMYNVHLHLSINTTTIEEPKKSIQKKFHSG